MGRFIYRMCLAVILVIAVAGGVYYYKTLYKEDDYKDQGTFVDRRNAAGQGAVQKSYMQAENRQEDSMMQEAEKTVKEAAKQTGKTVKEAAKQTGKTVKQAAKQTGRTVKEAAQQAGEEAKEAFRAESGYITAKAQQAKETIRRQMDV